MEEITKVELVRSPRRRKTLSAKVLNNTMYVYVPISLPEARLGGIIEKFKSKFTKLRLKNELNSSQSLKEIAEKLNKRYFAGRLFINSIEYVTNQESKFGCCDVRLKDIRISYKVGKMPPWVRDYVIIHELAHLVEPNHSKEFWEIVFRYKLAERAKGFLIAKGLEENELACQEVNC